MWLRLLSIVFFILCGAFCGICYSEKLKRRVSICNEAEKLMRSCAVMIRTSGADIFHIIKALKGEELCFLRFLYTLPEEFSTDCDIRKLWCDAIGNDQDMPGEEKAVLREFGSILGTSDTEGQLVAITSQLLRMEELREQRRLEYMQKGKLYRSLGVMAGVSVGIILI